jgi:hypothetical protein
VTVARVPHVGNPQVSAGRVAALNRSSPDHLLPLLLPVCSGQLRTRQDVAGRDPSLDLRKRDRSESAGMAQDVRAGTQNPVSFGS